MPAGILPISSFDLGGVHEKTTKFPLDVSGIIKNSVSFLDFC